MSTITDRDRKVARGLPDEFVRRAGTPTDRVTALVDAHWSSASAAHREALTRALLPILEPLQGSAGEIGASIRVQCVEVVAEWIVQQ